MMSPLRKTLLIWAALASPAWAVDWSVCPGIDTPEAQALPDRYEVFVSPWTHHWSHSEEHKKVGALTLSRLLPQDRFCGFSLFRNSFGQPSAYAFTGWSWPHLLASQPQVYASLTGGVIYGYVGKYKDKVPLNVGGFSPVLIPALGYRVTPAVGLEVQILGTAAVMFGTTVRF